MADAYLPGKGDLIWIDLDPRTGHEQSGHRPALVLSLRAFTLKTGLAVICPITSKVRGMAFEVPVTGKKIQGAVLPMHVRSVDVRMRGAQFAEKAPAAILRETLEKLGTIIGY